MATTARASRTHHGLKTLIARLRWSSDAGAAMLLGVAALATAWSSYQASVWGGIQASNYTRSSVLRGQASQASDEAARTRLVDAVLFTRWLEADVDHKPRLAMMYEMHFRQEFRLAFDAWRAIGDTEVAMRTTPLDRPEYQIARAKDAERLQLESTRALQAGEHANDVSNVYFFITVILATVLFFGGALRPLVPPQLKSLVVLIATLLCIWAISQLVKAPMSR